MKYIISIIIIILACFMVIKTQWFIENFGHSSWAEAKLGGGGTRLMYKALGIIFIVVSLLIMTDMMGPIIMSVFGRLFGF